MSIMQQLTAVPSPRTPETPRAFTLGEFARGALFAWVWFQPSVAVAGVVVGTIVTGYLDGATLGLLPIIVGFPYTVAATVLGSPFAYVIGCALRRVPNDFAHLGAFAAYGVVVGAVTTHLALGQSTGTTALAVMCGSGGAVALPLGWWTTSRQALRGDRRGRRPAEVEEGEQA